MIALPMSLLPKKNLFKPTWFLLVHATTTMLVHATTTWPSEKCQQFYVSVCKIIQINKVGNPDKQITVKLPLFSLISPSLTTAYIADSRECIKDTQLHMHKT